MFCCDLYFSINFKYVHRLNVTSYEFTEIGDLSMIFDDFRRLFNVSDAFRLLLIIIDELTYLNFLADVQAYTSN